MTGHSVETARKTRETKISTQEIWSTFTSEKQNGKESKHNMVGWREATEYETEKPLREVTLKLSSGSYC